MRKLFGRLDVLVASLTLLVCIVVGNMWLPTFVHRTSTIHRLLAQPRDLVMTMYLSHPSPLLRSEVWRFHDLDGNSRIRYEVTGARGDASVTEPPSARVDVPALFDAAKSLGLWRLPRGGGDCHIYLAARLGNVWEKHDIFFSTAQVFGRKPREYHLDLSHESAHSALMLLRLESTPEPDGALARYLEDVRAFGTPAFRAASQAARNQVQIEEKGRR